jgi:hypothetical protein
MKKTLFLGVFFLAFLFIFAYADKKMPDTESSNIWSYLQDQNYTKWQLFPKTTELSPGQSPHGAFITTYINKKTVESVKNNSFAYGSIIVKENYTPEKSLAAVTIMYKVEGFDPDGGDWYWAKYSPNGETQVAGKADGCIQCHSTVKDSDWSFLKSRM